MVSFHLGLSGTIPPGPRGSICSKLLISWRSHCGTEKRPESDWGTRLRIFPGITRLRIFPGITTGIRKQRPWKALGVMSLPVGDNALYPTCVTETNVCARDAKLMNTKRAFKRGIVLGIRITSGWRRAVPHHHHHHPEFDSDSSCMCPSHYFRWLRRQDKCGSTVLENKSI